MVWPRLSDLCSSPGFWLVFLNLASFIFVLLTPARPELKAKDLRFPWVFHRALVLFNIGPVWILPLLPQRGFLDSPTWMDLAIGLVISSSAIVIYGLALRQSGFLQGAPAEGKVHSTGIYSVIRHPISLGNILFPFGLAVIFNAVYALLYVWIIVAAFYAIQTILEEKSLLEHYGDAYLIYRKKVHYRLVPYLF